MIVSSASESFFALHTFFDSNRRFLLQLGNCGSWRAPTAVWHSSRNDPANAQHPKRFSFLRPKLKQYKEHFFFREAMTVQRRERAKNQESSFCQAGNRLWENGKQVRRSLLIFSKEGGSGMVGKPELLHAQATDGIGQDFFLAYQRAVLLALRRQGVLNEIQCRNCVQKLEEQIKNTSKSNSVK